MFTWRRDIMGNLASRWLTNALAEWTAVALIVLNGRRTFRTFGGRFANLLP